MTFKFIVFVAILLCLLLPCVASAALVEYPQEYYTDYNNGALFARKSESAANLYGVSYDPIRYASLANYYELRRHTILLERQNELLAEQNALLRNMTARCG